MTLAFLRGNMSASGSTRGVSPEDVLAVFDERADPAEPLTAPEVAETLSASRRTVFNRLDDLRKRGELASKKVGGRSRVWWIPDEEAAPAAPLKDLVGMLDEDEADRVEQRQREWREGFSAEIEGDRLERDG
jgi:predicted transcriptional regulator